MGWSDGLADSILDVGPGILNKTPTVSDPDKGGPPIKLPFLMRHGVQAERLAILENAEWKTQVNFCTIPDSCHRDKILFYMHDTKPMTCFQDGLWFAPIELVQHHNLNPMREKA